MAKYPGVYKRGSSWAWRAQFSEDGQRTSLSGSGFPSAREAHDARLEALRDATEPAARPDLTVAEWLWSWLESRDADLRSASIVAYRCAIRAGVKHSSTLDVPLARFDEDRARRLVSDLRAGGYAHQTLVNYVSGISTGLNAAVRAGLLRSNHLESIRVVRTTEARQYLPWSADEARAFLEHRRAAQDPLYYVWHLVLSTGLRKGEVHGLRWSDIQGRRLYVRRQRTSIDGRTVEGPPKTEGSETYVTLDQRTVDVLNDVPRTSEYVVTDPRTSRPYVHMGQFQRDWRRALRDAQARVIRFHDLRHTCASLLGAAGVPLADAQRRLRHWSPTMTMHYTHAYPDAQESVADTLGDILGPGK